MPTEFARRTSERADRVRQCPVRRTGALTAGQGRDERHWQNLFASEVADVDGEVRDVRRKISDLGWQRLEAANDVLTGGWGRLETLHLELRAWRDACKASEGTRTSWQRKEARWNG